MRTHLTWVLHPTAVLLCVLAVALYGFAVPVGADPHPGQSVNVAIVSSPAVINGGALPTTSADFAAFNFFNVPVASLSLTNLQNGALCGGAPCDTVVLNVASSGIGCNAGNLSAGQKADLNSFVQSGGKLIIYDSECTFGGSVDYSWLTFPFTTNNPGAAGAQGTLTISDDSILASSNPANVHFIDAAAIGSQTDAVGDMNVVTTLNPNWCLSLTGTNVNNVTGATHMYGRSGTGMYIYNGMDVDYLSGGTSIGATGAGQLAKVWLQELQAAPALLPANCAVSVAGVSLSPGTASNSIGTSHTVTATVTDLGVPQPSVSVTITVVSGPNAGISGTGLTDANGQVTLTWTGTGGVGTDHIQACLTNNPQACSQEVTKEWTAGGVAGVPLNLVMSATFTLRQYRPGVKDDRLVEVGDFTLPPGTPINPIADPVVVTLSEAGCGGAFSSLTVPPGSFVKHQGGRIHTFTGSLTDGITADVVQTYIRILRKIDDTYTVALDVRDADYTCLEGNTNRKVTTTIDIGGDVATGDACFARLRSGDLYFPVKGATCP